MLDAAIIRKRLLDESDVNGPEVPEGRNQVWTKEALDWVMVEASRSTYNIQNAFKPKPEILVNISVLGRYIKVIINLIY